MPSPACPGCGAPGYQPAEPVSLILLRLVYARLLAATGQPLGAVEAHLLAHPHVHERIGGED